MSVTHDLRDPALWIILATSTTACVGVPWQVTVPLGTAGLFALSFGNCAELKARAEAVGAMREFWQTVGLSVLNAGGTSAAAHLVGVGAGWMWGR